MEINEATNYLYAFYSNFGTEFRMVYENLKSVANVSLFISDYDYKNYNDYKNFQEFLDDNIVFVFVSNSKYLEKALLFMQTHSNYVTDYEKEDGHMIVFKVDEPHKNALRQFKQSRYSKMYHTIDVGLFFDKSAKYYAKYIEDGKVKMITDKNCINIYNLQEVYHSLRLSYFHVLTRNVNLKHILECIYSSEIPAENEFVEKIKMSKEVYNYRNHYLTKEKQLIDAEG